MNRKDNVMKNMVTFLAISLLFFSTARASTNDCSCAKSITGVLRSECSQAFFNGVAAGAAVGISAEFIRPYFMQLTDGLNLYNNYGVCRGVLSGEVITAGAVAALSAFKKLSLTKTTAQVTGIIVGACAATYATKVLAQDAVQAPQ